MAEQRTTGWVGWIWFAAVMCVLVGVFNVIDGLVALFRDTLYVVGANGLVAFDFTTWGWIHLIIGALQVIGGIALFGGRTWAQALVCVLVGINAVTQLVFLPAFPVWSVLVIAMDVVTLYAILVHGREVRGAVRENFGDARSGGYSAGYTAGAAGGRHQAPDQPMDRPEAPQDRPVAGPRAQQAEQAEQAGQAEQAQREARPSAG